ncbi:MAG: hypothetical protein ABL934_00535 [Lysobacteraceae bacterium]
MATVAPFAKVTSTEEMRAIGRQMNGFSLSLMGMIGSWLNTDSSKEKQHVYEALPNSPSVFPLHFIVLGAAG